MTIKATYCINPEDDEEELVANTKKELLKLFDFIFKELRLFEGDDYDIYDDELVIHKEYYYEIMNFIGKY